LEIREKRKELKKEKNEENEKNFSFFIFFFFSFFDDLKFPFSFLSFSLQNKNPKRISPTKLFFKNFFSWKEKKLFFPFLFFIF
jgi:hypothetical protein